MVFNASDTGFALLIPLRFAATSVGECPSGIWDISVQEEGMAKLEGQKGRNVWLQGDWSRDKFAPECKKLGYSVCSWCLEFKEFFVCFAPQSHLLCPTLGGFKERE